MRAYGVRQPRLRPLISQLVGADRAGQLALDLHEQLPERSLRGAGAPALLRRGHILRGQAQTLAQVSPGPLDVAGLELSQSRAPQPVEWAWPRACERYSGHPMLKPPC